MNKPIIILCAVTLVGMSCSFAGHRPARDVEITVGDKVEEMDKLRTEINQFLDDWNDAMVAADTARLCAMMDNNIVLRHMSGMTQTKAEWLSEVASRSMNYHKIVKRDVEVSFQDKLAADVNFTSVITATIGGAHGTWTLHGTMKLANRAGKWIRIE